MRRTDHDQLTIALVSEHASPLAALGGVDAGGQNVHVAQLARALADRGHRVAVHTRRDDDTLPGTVELSPSVTVHHVPAGPPRHLPKDELQPFMGEFGRFLADEWAVARPDVVHAHFWMSGLAAGAACRRLGLPFVQTYHALGTVKRRHQGAADTSPPDRIAVETAIGQECDRIIATCRDEVRELAAMRLPENRADIVPCGVDPQVFTPQGPRAARGPLPYRLVQIGRLVPRKNAAVSITALAGLPDAELVIVGGPEPERLDEDPEVRRLRAVARDKGVADRVRFTGGVPRDTVPGLLRSADVVLCPPAYEPFGIVPLEAMSCGVPVVASAVGGHLDSVADPETGCLVPPGDPAALAAAVARLLDDPADREARGAAGRRRVLARYGWDRVAASTEDVYRDVLRNRRRTPAARAA